MENSTTVYRRMQDIDVRSPTGCINSFGAWLSSGCPSAKLRIVRTEVEVWATVSHFNTLMSFPRIRLDALHCTWQSAARWFDWCGASFLILSFGSWKTSLLFASVCFKLIGISWNFSKTAWPLWVQSANPNQPWASLRWRFWKMKWKCASPKNTDAVYECISNVEDMYVYTYIYIIWCMLILWLRCVRLSTESSQMTNERCGSKERLAKFQLGIPRYITMIPLTFCTSRKNWIDNYWTKVSHSSENYVSTASCRTRACAACSCRRLLT